MFTTDGTAHKNGTKNEDRVKERFETSRSLFGLDELYGSLVAVIKKGGTQNKADLILEYEKNSVALSVKNSQGATHDWINTTRLPTEGFESVQKWIKENKGKFVEFARNYPKNSDEAKSLIKQKKLELEKITEVCFNSVNSKFLKSFITNEFNKIKPQYILFSDKKGEVDYLYEGKDLPIFQQLEDENSVFALKQKRDAKTSRSIFCDDKDTGLRLRIVLNNGMGALLAGKLWSSNATSSLTIKLQQDDPLSVIENLKKKDLVLGETIKC